MKKYRGPDSVHAEDLRDAKRFFQKTKALRRRAGITARDLWEFRARALRRGADPVGLFIWMCFHPEEARKQVTNADEDDARASWKHFSRRRDVSLRKLSEPLVEAYSMERARSAPKILKRIRELKSVRRSAV